MKFSWMASRTMLLLVVVLLFFLTSCNYIHNRKVRQISKMEQEIHNMPMNDTALSMELVESYQKFSEKYPKDTISPSYLFRAAGICLNLGKTSQAIQFYKMVPVQFQGSKWTPYSLFMLAFVYENYLRDLNTAKSYYEHFLAGYPNHELRNDAENALEYLGKTAEQMLKEMMEMRRTDTLQLKFRKPLPGELKSPLPPGK